MRNLRTAESRLSRILYLLPLCTRDGGARIDELAAALGVDRSVILDDINQLTSRSYYHPAGSGDDLQVNIEGEDDRVSIWTKGSFQRPPRLSPRETLALGLGLRAIAAEATPERRAELLELARRLEAELTTPEESTVHYSALMIPDTESAAIVMDAAYPVATVLADDGGDILTLILDAARDRRVCRIKYLKAGAPEPDVRRIHPYELAFAEGLWYILSHAENRNAIRIFRIDRILEAERLDDEFTVPDDFDAHDYIGADGRLYRGEDDTRVAVRYAPEIARWIKERTPCEPAEDGSVVVQHRVADLRWVVRHVLQYGSKAEILGPEEVRRMVGRVTTRISKETTRYRTDLERVDGTPELHR